MDELRQRTEVAWANYQAAVRGQGAPPDMPGAEVALSTYLYQRLLLAALAYCQAVSAELEGGLGKSED